MEIDNLKSNRFYKMLKKYAVLLCTVWASTTLMSGAQIGSTTDKLGKFQATYGVGLNVQLNGYKDGLKAQLGVPPAGYSPQLYRKCDEDKETGSLCLKTHESMVKVQNAPTGRADAECYTVTWFNPPSNQEDCIDLSGAKWYGGGELRFQYWPISNLSQSRNAYVTGDFFHHPYGGVIERAWYSSQGYSITVDETTPLFLRFNQSGDNQLCFSASYDEYPYSTKYEMPEKQLIYTVCAAKNIRDVLDYSLARWTKKPKTIVDLEVIDKPIWSTWAKYKAAINEKIVLDYANEIASHGFEASHLEIDDKWETCYGQLEFDKTKFPDPKGMVDKIHKMGFGVSFWVHPFINLDCPAFEEGSEKLYFVRELESPETTFKTTWWNGDAGYIDFTNPEAVDWYLTRLKKAQNESGLNTYKFDAGELRWLNGSFLFNDPDIMRKPTLFTQKYTQTAAKFGTGVEVRSAYKSQDLPIFIRMLDKDSKWTYDNGLKTLIPTALLFSIHGYPFVLPDMIGGNAYGDSIPERELYIRWLEANVFMPSLQFSILPWQYDQETVDITKKMVNLHAKYGELFKQLANEAITTGNPIIRPLWWNDPEDENALVCDDQFLLGDDILVAPILEQGIRQRDIYLPKGNWRAMMDSDVKVYYGPTWIKAYHVPLDQLPYFRKV